LSAALPRLFALLRDGGARRTIAIIGIKFEWQFKYRDESEVNAIA